MLQDSEWLLIKSQAELRKWPELHIVEASHADEPGSLSSSALPSSSVFLHSIKRVCIVYKAVAKIISIGFRRVEIIILSLIVSQINCAGTLYSRVRKRGEKLGRHVLRTLLVNGQVKAILVS